MKAARDADSSALVINAGARRAAAAPDLVLDGLERAGLPISAVHHVGSGVELAGTLDRVAADGHDLVVVGGGGNAVSPTAGIDDHTLDIYAIPGAPLREHVRIARLLKDGSFVERDGVYHVTTQRVRLVTEPPMPVNLDGEIATVTPADFTVDRNAVHVVVPRHSTAASLDD